MSESCQDPLSSSFGAGLQGAGCGPVMCPRIPFLLGSLLCFPRVLPTELSLHTLCFYCLTCLCYQGQLEDRNQGDFVIDAYLGPPSGDPVDVVRVMCSGVGAWQWACWGGRPCFGIQLCLRDSWQDRSGAAEQGGAGSSWCCCVW